MGKDNRESALDKGGASPLVVPSVSTQRNIWNLPATAYRLAAEDSDALLRFAQGHHEIENAIRQHKSIGEDDAKALAKRIKELHLSRSFDGREDHRAFLVGECLKLKEGKSFGDVYAAFVSLEVANPPPKFSKWVRAGSWLNVKLAMPAELKTAFGVHSDTWLQYRSVDFVREHERKDFPPSSFDGGSFFFSLDPGSRRSQPEPGVIPVVPAPEEDTIAQYIEKAPSRPDLWDALVKAAAIVHRNKQPVGDALQGWLTEAAGREAQRPKRSTAEKWPENALRDFAIREAIRALERCGVKAATNDREPGSACVVCAKVFMLSAATVFNIWKRRDEYPRVMR